MEHYCILLFGYHIIYLFRFLSEVEIFFKTRGVVWDLLYRKVENIEQQRHFKLGGSEDMLPLVTDIAPNIGSENQSYKIFYVT